MKMTLGIVVTLTALLASVQPSLHAQPQKPPTRQVQLPPPKKPLQFPIRKALPEPAPEAELDTVTIKEGTGQESMLDTVTATLGRGYNSLLDEKKGTCLNGQ